MLSSAYFPLAIATALLIVPVVLADQKAGRVTSWKVPAAVSLAWLPVFGIFSALEWVTGMPFDNAVKAAAMSSDMPLLDTFCTVIVATLPILGTLWAFLMMWKATGEISSNTPR